MDIVLGVGSPFADDQAGLFVAKKLLASKECQAVINRGSLIIELCDRPGLNLLHWFGQDYDRLYLIDMVKTNLATIGNIYTLNGCDILNFSGMMSSHSFGIASSLGLAVALKINIDKVTFWGIEGSKSSPEDCISSEVLAATNKVVKQIINSIANRSSPQESIFYNTFY